MKITKTQLSKIIKEELNNTMLEGLMLEQQNVEKAAELAANMKDTPEVEAIFATLDKDPEAQKALKSILAQLPDENIEEAEDLDPAGGIATAATFLMVGNTMYQVAAGKALMGAVIAAGLPIAAGLTGLALVALAMKYVRNKKGKAAMRARVADGDTLSLTPQEEEALRKKLAAAKAAKAERDGKPLNEGKKITKSKLAQIIKEELADIKAEGYGAYKRNDKKGLSPQYRGTDAASTDDTEDRFHKSEHSPYSDKKPKRGKKDLGEAEGRYEFELDPKVQQSVLQALAKSGTGALDFPLPLTPEQEKSYRHLDDGDRQSMLRDVVEELVELGKIKVVKVADGERESLYYAVQGLDEGGYDDEYDYGADEQAEEEYFSQALWDAVDGALEDWNGTPAPKHEIITGAPEGIDELDWDEMGEKYLSSLIDDGTVELRQGAPGDDWNGEEELYVLALR
jgi:hypothetical protein